MQEFELLSGYRWFKRGSKRQNTFFFAGWFLFVLYFSLPGMQLPLLEYYTVKISSLMEQRAFERLRPLPPLHSTVAFSSVHPYLFKGIIGMEDGNFFTHHGIDWDALKESMEKNKSAKKIKRGGSTVSMQLSKNLFFTTERSVIRKAKEMLTTMRMEKEISKQAIMTQYVNTIEWGDNIYGIDDASDYYFKKSPSSLKADEIARLVAVIPGPLVYRPDKLSRYVQRRSAIVSGRFGTPLMFETTTDDKPKKTPRTGRRR